MKKTLMTLSIAALSSLGAHSALADNATIEDAIKSRSDLSSFYEALVNTGVNHELKSNTSYTVFAPTNDAFAKITQDKYPCFYEVGCRAEIADIVRNHIIPEQVYVSDAAKQKGGVYSIDRRFVTIGGRNMSNSGNTNASTFTADGRNITSTNQLLGGMLYKIDGVIADEQELAVFKYPSYAFAPADEVITTRRVIDNAPCDNETCLPEVRETTTIRTTTPVLVPVSRAAPAR